MVENGEGEKKRRGNKTDFPQRLSGLAVQETTCKKETVEKAKNAEKRGQKKRGAHHVVGGFVDIGI